MNKDIYYIAAKNLLKWAPEYRRDIMDKLISPYERECVRQAFAEIKRRESLNCIGLICWCKSLSNITSAKQKNKQFKRRAKSRLSRKE